MFQNNRPRYWVSWFDRWHLWLALLFLLLACILGYLTITTPAPTVTLASADPNAVWQADKPIELRGTAPANSIVRVYAGDTLLGKTRADDNGNYKFTLPNIAAGAHAFKTVAEYAGAQIESGALTLNVNAPTVALKPTTAPTATQVPPTSVPTRPPAATQVPPTTAPTLASTATRASATATAAPIVTPTLGIGSVQRRGTDNAEMVYVPAGEFAFGDEKSARPSYLAAFWLDKFEVTNEQFQQFVTATGYKTEAEKLGWGSEFVGVKWEQIPGITWRAPRGASSAITNKPKQPVVLVSWNDASAYCAWASKRLPTEAEWEKTARGTDGRVFPWGNTWDGTKLNYCDTNCAYSWKDSGANDGNAESAPVGSYASGASFFGALDMAGNVWEWTADWDNANYTQTMPARNLTGAGTGQLKILRGGAWSIDQAYARTTNRFSATPDYRESSVGLRCAQ